jgi:diphthamide synthase (EF-2-diphthine--ammonia ligase)
MRSDLDRMLTEIAGSGIDPLFPLWGLPADTPLLARKMLDSGLKAVLTCVDPAQLDAKFVGRDFDEAFLRDLPATVDPCGERGEFHTFCCAGPMFARPIQIRRVETRLCDRFWFADLAAANASLGGSSISIVAAPWLVCRLLLQV